MNVVADARMHVTQSSRIHALQSRYCMAGADSAGGLTGMKTPQGAGGRISPWTLGIVFISSEKLTPLRVFSVTDTDVFLCVGK